MKTAPQDDPAKSAPLEGELLPQESTSDGTPGTPGSSEKESAGNGGTANGSTFLPKWLGENLTFSGGWTTSFRSNSVSGGSNVDPELVDEFNYYDARKLGPFQQQMDLTVQGKLFNVFNLNARFSNSRYGNYFNNTFGFNYNSKGTTLDIGDVNATLPGNGLVSFSKSLQGLMISRDFGGGKIRMTNIASLTRAATRRGSFRGQGTSGPYFLNAASIVEGTERLRVNGVDLKPGAKLEADPNRPAPVGTDLTYSIDYFTGQVYFSAIIPPEATVEYSYESRSYNSTPGFLFGQRLDFALGGGNTLGVTWLQQKSSGRRGGARDVTERFPVIADPNYRYTLSSLIEPGTPVEVRWLEQPEPLVPGIDYELNEAQHFVRLKRILPPDTAITARASLSIRYRPVRTAQIGGDRSVMGLDGSVGLGNLGNLALEFGRSQSPEGNSSGQAMRATATLRGGGSGGRNQWSSTLSWRDIGAGFSMVDSVSGAFLRAEKGLNANLTFAPTQHINFISSFTRSRIAQQGFGFGLGYGGSDASGAASQALTWATNASWNAGIQLDLPNLPRLDFMHSQITQTSGGGAGSRSAFTSDSLNLSWQRGIFTLTGSLGRTLSRGRSVFLSGYNVDGFSGGSSYLGDIRNGVNLPASGNDSSSTSSRLSVSLTPAEWITLTGNLGFSRTTFGSSSQSQVSSSNSRARDFAYHLSLNPLQNLTISASVSDTSNGQSTALFYNNPLPSNSGQTNTGLGLGNTGALSGQRTRSRNLAINYTPFTNLTLSFDMNRQLSLIPGYDNTESASSQMGISYQPWSKLQISGQLVDQKVTYVGNQGDSSNRSYSLASTMGPFGKLTISTSLQRMNTGSALYYGGYGGSFSGVGGAGIGGTGMGGAGFSTGGYGGYTGRAFEGNPYGGYGTGGYGNYGGYGYGSSLSQRQNMTIFATRADYPLGGGRTLFFQWQTLDTRSPQGAVDDTSAGSGYRTSYNSQRSVGSIGLDFRITEIIGFTLDTSIIRSTDRDNPAYSYRARTMNADLSARF